MIEVDSLELWKVDLCSSHTDITETQRLTQTEGFNIMSGTCS